MSILLSSWKTRLVSFLKAEKTAKLQCLVILPVYYVSPPLGWMGVFVVFVCMPH